MHRHTRAVASTAILIAVMAGTVSADDANSRTSREREMLRRAQEALRQSQQDNGELTSAKQAPVEAPPLWDGRAAGRVADVLQATEREPVTVG